MLLLFINNNKFYRIINIYQKIHKILNKILNQFPQVYKIQKQGSQNIIQLNNLITIIILIKTLFIIKTIHKIIIVKITIINHITIQVKEVQ